MPRFVKIAYLINQYPQASQSFIRREIAALVARGVEVERFSVRRWDQKLVDAGDIGEQQKTRVVMDVGAVGLAIAMVRTMLGRPMAFWRGLKLAMRCGRGGDRGVMVHLAYLAEACVLRGWFAHGGIRHVHAHFGTNSAAVAMLVQEIGGPGYSFTCHGPEEFEKAAALKLGEKVARAKFVVAVSEFGRSQLYRWCDTAHRDKVQVVRCGLDEIFLNARRVLTPSAKRLVCVGRLAEQKGQLVLVEAAARLAEAGEEFELVLVGDGPMRGAIEGLIAKHKLQDRVRILGWLTNERVREEMIGSRALVLASFAEGLPVVCMEALALGRPVIATAVAGIPELVEPGVNGWLVAPGEVEPLAEAMRAALRAETRELDAMGERGAQRVAEMHNAATEAGKLAELFAGVMGVEGETAGATPLPTSVGETAASAR